MKNYELRTILEILEDVSQLPGKEQAIVVIENKKSVLTKLSELGKLTAIPEQIKNFVQQRNKIVFDNSKKDENGRQMRDAEGKIIVYDSEKLTNLLETHDVAFPEEKKMYVEFQEKTNSILNEECNIELKKIDIDSVSPHINAYQLEALEFMITKKLEL
jgi:hypothetical protein